MDELLERSDALAILTDALGTVEATSQGRLVMIAGEAGVGKTALLDAFCVRAGPSVRVLSGACEALNTPRPLGPLLDIAAETGGELATVTEGRATPSDVLAALLDELRRRSPTVVLLEDLHWADEATLDLLRLIARRVATVPALVVATHRDELDRQHPLRVTLGELPRSAVERVLLQALSEEAVAQLAEPHGVDARELYERTDGNPFYVTEALATGGAALPDSVRDAVHARAARLDPQARELLDAVAIVPPRAELWLLEAVADSELDHLEECIASGMLRADRDAVAFRHEIARVAIEEELAPDRRMELHRRALSALAARAGQADLARLAHHAEAGGDVAAVLEHAPAAGERAAVLAAHREAAAQFARALRFAEALPAEERTALLDRRSYECYLTNAMDEAIEARKEALDAYSDRGDALRAGDAHRWLSRLYWFKGDNLAAEEEAARAVELLETLPPGVELAWAYSNMAQLRMLASDYSGAVDWGGKAIELAEPLDQKEILAHALNNLGTAEFQIGLPEGPEKIERSLELALEAGLEEHVARGYTNLGCSWIENRDYKRGDAYLEAGIAYCRDHDLESWRVYMTGWLGRSLLEQGRWDDAATAASSILSLSSIAVPSRISALVVIGRLRTRRGDPDAWAPLDEARTLARATMELQRVVPVAAARAEAHLLEGHPELVADETDEAVALALEHGRGWQLGEVCAWRHRAGIPATEPEVLASAEPYRLELGGDAEQASKLWQELGCPYEAAIVLFDSGDEELLRWGLAQLQELGARPAAARAARLLRERGARDLRMGPRASTRENVAGLTTRELEVLKLLADGMRNAQIAERLVLSPKTVAHHVSAILRKLGTSTRTEAATEAGRLGLLEK